MLTKLKSFYDEVIYIHDFSYSDNGLLIKVNNGKTITHK